MAQVFNRKRKTVLKEGAMKILAINATYRPQQTTSRLTQAALEGAASQGAATEMVLLKELDIRYCTNCLTCYQDHKTGIGPCSQQDDTDMILEKIQAADGVIFASPVHIGFVTGLMTVFFERIAWRLARSTGEFMGIKGLPEPRLIDKARAVATIVSAGTVPQEMRAYCDVGTPWLLENGALYVNGSPVGDLYAGACFPRPLSHDEQRRALLFRELTADQLEQAYQLGAAMAQAIKAGRVKPYTFSPPAPA
jgi:multimeric flavodoxin WrbA